MAFIASALALRSIWQVRIRMALTLGVVGIYIITEAYLTTYVNKFFSFYQLLVSKLEMIYPKVSFRTN